MAASDSSAAFSSPGVLATTVQPLVAPSPSRRRDRRLAQEQAAPEKIVPEQPAPAPVPALKTFLVPKPPRVERVIHASSKDVLVTTIQESIAALGASLSASLDDATHLLVLMNANLHSINQGVEGLIKDNHLGVISKQLDSLVAIGRAQVLNQLVHLDSLGIKAGYNAVKDATRVYCLVKEQADNPVDGVGDDEAVPKV